MYGLWRGRGFVQGLSEASERRLLVGFEAILALIVVEGGHIFEVRGSGNRILRLKLGEFFVGWALPWIYVAFLDADPFCCGSCLFPAYELHRAINLEVMENSWAFFEAGISGVRSCAQVRSRCLNRLLGPLREKHFRIW